MGKVGRKPVALPISPKTTVARTPKIKREKLPQGVLKNWGIQRNLLGEIRLTGYIVKHSARPELISDSRKVITSAVQRADFLNGKAWTRNTLYTLID